MGWGSGASLSPPDRVSPRRGAPEPGAGSVVNLDRSIGIGVAVLVVHGVWIAGESAPGRLALWAEDPALPLTTSSRARRRPHPFAVSAGALATALTGASDELRDALAKAAEAELTLR